MIARPRGKPIHYLRNVERWIWVLVGGGALLLFFAIVSSFHWWRCPQCGRSLPIKSQM